MVPGQAAPLQRGELGGGAPLGAPCQPRTLLGVGPRQPRSGSAPLTWHAERSAGRQTIYLLLQLINVRIMAKDMSKI